MAWYSVGICTWTASHKGKLPQYYSSFAGRKKDKTHLFGNISRFSTRSRLASKKGIVGFVHSLEEKFEVTAFRKVSLLGIFSFALLCCVRCKKKVLA